MDFHGFSTGYTSFPTVKRILCGLCGVFEMLNVGIFDPGPHHRARVPEMVQKIRKIMKIQQNRAGTQMDPSRDQVRDWGKSRITRAADMVFRPDTLHPRP